MDQLSADLTLAFRLLMAGAVALVLAGWSLHRKHRRPRDLIALVSTSAGTAAFAVVQLAAEQGCLRLNGPDRALWTGLVLSAVALPLLAFELGLRRAPRAPGDHGASPPAGAPSVFEQPRP